MVLNPKAEYGWAPGVTVRRRAEVGHQQHPRQRLRLRPRHGSGREKRVRRREGARELRAVWSDPRRAHQEGQDLLLRGFRKAIEKHRFDLYGSSSDLGRLDTAAPEVAATLTTAIARTAFRMPSRTSTTTLLRTLARTQLSALSLNLVGCNATSANITATTVTPALIAACANGNQFGAPDLFGNTSGHHHHSSR